MLILFFPWNAFGENGEQTVLGFVHTMKKNIL